MKYKVVPIPPSGVGQGPHSEVLRELEKLKDGESLLDEGILSEIRARGRAQYAQNLWRNHHKGSRVTSTIKRQENGEINLYLWITKVERD